MEFKNPITEQVINIDDSVVKGIIEQILFTSSNGSNYASMPQLEGTNHGYAIVSHPYFIKKIISYASIRR